MIAHETRCEHLQTALKSSSVIQRLRKKKLEQRYLAQNSYFISSLILKIKKKNLKLSLKILLFNHNVQLKRKNEVVTSSAHH